jgi:hypothetical protein
MADSSDDFNDIKAAVGWMCIVFALCVVKHSTYTGSAVAGSGSSHAVRETCWGFPMKLFSFYPDGYVAPTAPAGPSQPALIHQVGLLVDAVVAFAGIIVVVPIRLLRSVRAGSGRNS